MKKSRVFVGPGNIAGNAASVSNSLKKAGIYSESYSYKSHPFGYTCDHDGLLILNPYSGKKVNIFQRVLINKYTLNTIKFFQKSIVFIVALFRFNSFIFISHETFYENNRDLFFLKILRKKIAFLFVGCPERDPLDLINKTDKGFCSFCKDYDKQKFLKCYNGEKKQKKIKYISEKADIIFSHKDTISFISDKSKVRRFYCTTEYNADFEGVKNKYYAELRPIICHFPSNSLLKGTKYVVKAIEELQQTGLEFTFNCKRVANNELKEELSQAHILIDQFSFGHGLLAVEGMASGCVVVCRTSKWFKEDFPELPVISCEPQDLSSVLNGLISDRNRMFNIALKSLDYYQRYHTPEVIGQYYRETLGLI